MRPFALGVRSSCAVGAMLTLINAAVIPRARAQSVDDDGPISLLWTERKPFQYAGEKGQAQGILVDIGNKIFSRAGLPTTSDVVPANRVIKMLERNEQSVCAVGWYKSPEREAIAQFSQPVYQDRSLRGVFRTDTKIAPGTSAKTLFEDQMTRFVLKQGFAYGPVLDELIARKNPALIERVTVDAPSLLRMVKARRADAALLAQEEIDYYGKAEPDFAKDFKIVVFGGLPEAEQRYVMCSKRISPATMAKINGAIAATVKLK